VYSVLYFETADHLLQWGPVCCKRGVICTLDGLVGNYLTILSSPLSLQKRVERVGWERPVEQLTTCHAGIVKSQNKGIIVAKISGSKVLGRLAKIRGILDTMLH
jgi:hypothetical protein